MMRMEGKGRQNVLLPYASPSQRIGRTRNSARICIACVCVCLGQSESIASSKHTGKHMRACEWRVSGPIHTCLCVSIWHDSVCVCISDWKTETCCFRVSLSMVVCGCTVAAANAAVASARDVYVCGRDMRREY